MALSEFDEKKPGDGGKRLYSEPKRLKEPPVLRDTEIQHQIYVASNKEEKRSNKSHRGVAVTVVPILLICSIVLIVILLKNKSDDTVTDNNENPMSFYVDTTTDLFTMDTSLFGISFDELKNQVGDSELTEPMSWTYWGKNLKYTYLKNGVMCFFQNNKLVMCTYDINNANTMPSGIYAAAKNHFGKDGSSLGNINGYDSMIWKFNSYTYEYFMEYYLDSNPKEYHFRQEYISEQYVE